MKIHTFIVTSLSMILLAVQLYGQDNSIVNEQNSLDPILLVANKHSNTLSYVNPKTFEVIRTIPTGPNPHEIIVTPDQRFAYLSNYA
ncbi:MAG: hypothetical protein KAI45_02830, partial [Melioribacteraceae bacterium]|nr:hypothetical protein [Melioribacteraceae bacterium]